MRKQSAFSLVELSIVLVILGLLVGGVLAGQSLIRAAELRAVSTEYSRWVTATQTFRDKYFALPGDMANATAFWGEDAAQCDTAGPNGTPGTCNGNGDGTINTGTAASTTGEQFQYWKQLSLAGLIEGTFTGTSNSVNARGSDIGLNIPASKLSLAGYGMERRPAISAIGSVQWIGSHGHGFIFGRRGTGNPPESSAIRPEEAWNIDTKIDDGRPSRGLVQTYYRHSYFTGNLCVTSNDDSTTEYLLSSSAIGCNFFLNAGL